MLVLFTSTVSYSQQTGEDTIPLEVLFQDINRSQFTISPNGKYYVEVYEENKGSYLFYHSVSLHIVDIDNYELVHSIPLDSYGVDAIYWLSDNRIIYESKGSIVAVNIDGTNMVRIANRTDVTALSYFFDIEVDLRYNTILSPLFNNDSEILVQTINSNLHAAIKKVNIFTREETMVMDAEKHKVTQWIADAYGNIKMAVKISNKGMEYYFKYDEAKDTLETFFLNIRGNQYSLTIDPKTHIKQYLTFEGLGHDPNIIFITSNIFTDKRQLLSYDMEKDEVVQTFISDVNCDIKDIHGEGISFIFDYYNKEIAGFKYTCLTPKYKWLSPKFGEKLLKLNRKYPQYFNEIIDHDFMGNRLLIHQWNDASSGNIGVYDVEEDDYSVMFLFNEALSQYELSRSKIVIAKARDQYNVPCYLNLPVHRKEGEKVPLVVIPHGGPWARDYWHADEFTQYFASRGYATLRINYRGSTGFGKSHVLAGVNSMDEVMVNDIADATQFIKGRYPIDENKVFIFGHSYGGYATYVGLAKYSELFKAGVSVAAPSDINSWMQKQKDDDNYYSYEFWNTALGTNTTDYLTKISPLSYAKDINNPLLILHGRMDDVVPVEQAEYMINRLEGLEKDFQYEIYNFSDHSFNNPKEFMQMLEESNQFFKSYMNDED
ncbi:MAG: alpha/beta fold hydrolase [Flavobacteriaceae bacterium]|nr:alpha/beta fold hydrolase [Flavobacteriaceae bacterium]